MSESVGWVGEGLAGKILFHGLLLTTAAGLFLAGSLVVPSVVHPICIEGGEYSGFPVAYWIQCRGPLLPGDGQSVDPPQLSPTAVVVDVAVWYLVMWGAVRVARRFLRPRADQ